MPRENQLLRAERATVGENDAFPEVGLQIVPQDHVLLCSSGALHVGVMEGFSSERFSDLIGVVYPT